MKSEDINYPKITGCGSLPVTTAWSFYAWVKTKWPFQNSLNWMPIMKIGRNNKKRKEKNQRQLHSVLWSINLYNVFLFFFFFSDIRPYFRSALDVISIHWIIIYNFIMIFYAFFFSSYSIYSIIIVDFFIGNNKYYLDQLKNCKKALEHWRLKMNVGESFLSVNANNIINKVIIK